MTTFESTASLTNLPSQQQNSLLNKNPSNQKDDDPIPSSLVTEEVNLTPFAPELTDKIIEYVYYNNPENIYSLNTNVKEFGKSISLVNSDFYLMSLKYLYRYANFTRSYSFHLFLKNLKKNPFLGRYVYYLDFSEFTSVGLGRTGQMMKEIQMVTHETILQCLELTPNLKEFLVSESIASDINEEIIDHLFNKLSKLKSIDLCGCSGQSFINALNALTIKSDESPIENLSLHDCTDIGQESLTKILPKLSNLKRLDLNHTQISAKILNDCINENTRLTHLSIGRCSSIGTTRDLIEFLTKHPSVNQHSLKWLNLQCDTTVASPFNSVTLSFLLKNLKARDLKYLNLGGLEVKSSHLAIINSRFINLESLVLSSSKLTIDELTQFLSFTNNLKFLDLTGNSNITRWSIDNNHFLKCCETLQAIEVDEKIVDSLEYSTGKITMYNLNNKLEIWKPFNNNGQGRRNWVFKLDKEQMDKELKGEKLIFNNNIIYFDIKTGQKIMKKVKYPDFLKYASRKINCSFGPFSLHSENGDDVFPVDFSQRGLYKYYALNK